MQDIHSLYNLCTTYVYYHHRDYDYDHDHHMKMVSHILVSYQYLDHWDHWVFLHQKRGLLDLFTNDNNENRISIYFKRNHQ